MLKRQFVLDTNILVAGLRSQRGASFRLLQMLANNQLLLNVSVALALEYEAVLKRPGLIAGFSAAKIDAFLDYIFSVATLWPSVRDPDDERILEVAVQSDAIIVTHNKRDFDSARQFGVKIMSPSGSPGFERFTMSVSINISEELYEQACVIAEAHHIAVDDVFATAFSEQFSAWQRLRERAKHGDQDTFWRFLPKFPTLSLRRMIGSEQD